MTGIRIAETQNGAWEYVPAGGMALTAEQVEDVRTAREELRGYRNFTGYARPQVNRLIAAVDALFPATEPAEPCSRGVCSADDGHEGTCAEASGWAEPAEATINSMLKVPASEEVSGNIVAECNSSPAPAEPAEEETKAELCAVRLCVLPARHSGVHADREGLRWNNPTSSPVVPASTESGLWQDISEAPKHLTLIDRVGDKWTYDGDNWVTPETAILPVLYINRKYAPFVAAEEG